jgi:perosamine synthetase
MAPHIRVPLDWPNIGELEKRAVLDALDSGWVSTAGPLVREFEAKFEELLGVEHAIAAASGTAGLHIALKILGIGPGDEVIVPALTFVATANPVVHLGATPVIVDVDPATWNIDPAAIEGAITSRTRAIIVVHLYGNPADIPAILAIADRHNLHVVEDAAESLGSTLNGQHTGTFGRIGVFSFNGNKVITTGNGGMIATRDPSLARRARSLVNQARVPGSVEYEHEEAGFNYRLTNLQSALGLAQMQRLPEFVSAKRRFASLYRRSLGEAGRGLGWQTEVAGGCSNWWLFSVLMREGTGQDGRVALMKRLLARGIQVRPLFKPLNLQSYLRVFGDRTCPVAEDLYRRGVNLPSATFLAEQDIRLACDCLLEELAAHG